MIKINKLTNFPKEENIMSVNTLQNFVDSTIVEASQMSNAQIISEFAVHGLDNEIHFINFDRDSLIDLYVSDVCYGLFFHVYAKLLNTL